MRTHAISTCTQIPFLQGLILFTLPEASERLGVGAARFYVQLLALQLCPKSFPFYVMVDDSVLMWQLGERPGETVHKRISWWEALSHYETKPFAESMQEREHRTVTALSWRFHAAGNALILHIACSVPGALSLTLRLCTAPHYSPGFSFRRAASLGHDRILQA